jgi:hypothetical protein
MEAVSPFKALVNSYKATRHRNPKDNISQTTASLCKSKFIYRTRARHMQGVKVRLHEYLISETDGYG